MNIHPLSLFLENKPGHLAEPMRVPARQGIDVRTPPLADTRQFGILWMIVSDWPKANQALQQAGYIVNAVESVVVYNSGITA